MSADSNLSSKNSNEYANGLLFNARFLREQGSDARARQLEASAQEIERLQREHDHTYENGKADGFLEREELRAEIERLQEQSRSLKIGYDSMFDKAAELERGLSGETPAVTVAAAYETTPATDKEIIPLACSQCSATVPMPAANGVCDIRKAEGWHFSVVNGWRCPKCAAEKTNDYTKVREVMNPPGSAAEGPEARNLTSANVMGLEQVHRATEARPAEVVPLPLHVDPTGTTREPPHCPSCSCGMTPADRHHGGTTVEEREAIARRDTGIDDQNGQRLFEGDRVKVQWTAELGIKEINCEAVGTVEYMPDNISAAWFVQFDTPYRTGVCEEGIYETDSMMLIQEKSLGDECLIHFERLTQNGK